jgi:hypothetical protein
LDGGSAVDAGGACNIFILGDGLVAAAASAADVVTGVTETLEACGFDCVVAVFCCFDGGSVTDDVGDARNIPLFFLFLDDGSVAAAAAAADLVAGIVTGAARSGTGVAPTAGALA